MQFIGMPEVRVGPTGLPVLDPADVYAGFPFGVVARGADFPPPTGDPVAALRAALRPALRRPPCVVAFSGGRDSSLLLALAADVAARDGLPRPVALTLRYPGDTGAAESQWQVLVLDHLRDRGLPVERVVCDVHTELDLLGEFAAPVLRGHGGAVFPAAIGPTMLLCRSASGGALVTGNFGDEVLGGHRATLLRAVWRRRARRMKRSDWYTAATAAAPGPARTWLLHARAGGHAWLRPQFRGEVRRWQVADAAVRPLRWDRSVRAVLRTRAMQLGTATRERVASDCDCTLVEPLGAPAFLAALAEFGGRWGRLSRSGAIQLLAGDLLPAAVIARTQKAYFNRSRFGSITRDFASRWDGSGVDHDLVDAEALRQEWLSDLPSAASALLLHQAWLAQGRGAE